MSRRHANARHDYGEIRFYCPRGHLLEGRAQRIDAQHDARPDVKRPQYVTTRGIQRVDWPDGSTLLLLTCARCQQEGRRSDLRVSWERVVLPLLERNYAEMHSGPGVFRFT